MKRAIRTNISSMYYSQICMHIITNVVLILMGFVQVGNLAGGRGPGD